MNSIDRFTLNDDELGLIGHYPDKDQALRSAVPGNSIYDRGAETGDIELWLVGGDLERKIMRPIRRKRDWGLDR